MHTSFWFVSAFVSVLILPLITILAFLFIIFDPSLLSQIMPMRVALPGQQADNESHNYIHPSEGPSYIFISPKLNGSNYPAWSNSMERA